MTRPTLAFFGSSLVSAYWNGAATYYRGLLKALAARGWHITFYEPDAYDRQAHRDIPDPEWAHDVVYDPKNPDAVTRVLDEASKSEVVVKASGVGVGDDELVKGVLDRRRPGQLCIYWDVDAAATLDHLMRTPGDTLRVRLPEFDMVLTYGGGPPVCAAYKALGARDCVPIYNAVDPATHHPVPPSPRFTSDVSLVANRLPDREARIDEFFFGPASKLPLRTFTLAGSGWDDKPRPDNVHYVGHLYTRDHNAFNCSAHVVLNVNRDSMARMGYSPATRVFEAAGAGACVLTDRFDGVEEFFEPDHEILVVDGGESAASCLERIDAARAREIGEAARRRALAQHTYAHRVEQLETALAVSSR